MSDSDSDDIPELVPSSEEDDAPGMPEKTFADYAEIWLTKSPKFLEKQENNIKVFAMGPFLFAVNSIVPKPWMELVRNSGLLKYKKREMELSGLDWEEWAICDMVEAIALIMVKKLHKKRLLVQILECIHEIDKLKEKALEYNICLQVITKHDLVLKLWVRALKVPTGGHREKEAKCAVLYIAKLYEMVVMALARDSKDFSEERKKMIRSKDATDPMKFKDTGNEQYQRGNFETAIDYYTKAAKSDPFNHIFFGNRAQTYNRLKKYREALADGRRAVTLKPDWPKGHYRFAQAFHKYGQLDKAIVINEKGLDICKNNKMASDSNIRDLEQQGKFFRLEKEKILTDEKLHRVLQKSTFDNADEVNLPPHIRHLPGEKRIINMSKVFREMNVDVKLPTDPEYVSASSSDEEVPDLVDDDDDDLPPVTRVQHKGKDKVSSNRVSSTKPEVRPAKLDLPTETMEILELEKLLHDGNDAYNRGVAKNAATNFQKALHLVQQHKPKHFDMDGHDVVALKYAYADSAVATGLHKFIMDGMDKFDDILNNHQDTKFPLAHYGRAKAYLAMNRFTEAKEPLKKAWKVTNATKLTHITWPGTKNRIEENTHSVLMKRIKDLTLSCKYPPQPDARCRYHGEEEDKRTVIYFSDPDFKGFVRIRCNDQCIIEFHTHCWKVYKCTFGDLDKVGDKEMLERNCPTPECRAFIIKIIIFKQDTYKKEIDSDKTHRTPAKPKSPPKKQPACSEYKINRKKERKEMRKKRKKELQEEADDLMEDIDGLLDPEMSEEAKTKVHVEPVPTGTVEDRQDQVETTEKGAEAGEENPKPTSVLRRHDEDNLDKYKTTKKHKPKKKKERERTKPTVISLEVNFNDDREKQLYGEHNLDEDENQHRRGGNRDAFSVPSGLEHTVNAFERSYHNIDEITENLFVFFEELLQAHGPLHVEDTKITSMLEDFPPEAKDRVTEVGGLSQFLQQSKKFAMIDSIVCLLVDAGKARDISVAREISKSGALTVEQLNPNAIAFEPKPRVNVWESFKKGNNSSVNSENNLSDIVAGTSETASAHLFPDRTKTSKSSCGIDSLDEFSLNSPVKRAKTEARIHNLDSLDSIDDIDIFKQPKGGNSMETNDDIRWVSENDSESIRSSVSDRESVSSRGDTFDIFGKVGDYRDLPVKGLVVDSKADISAMSRSSSRSDVSERSSDISDLMTKPYKSDHFSSFDKSDVSDLMANAYHPAVDVTSPHVSPGPAYWAAPGSPIVRQGYGPIGSPVPSSTDSSSSATRPAPIGSPLTGAVHLDDQARVSPSLSPGVIRPPPIGLQLKHTLKEEVNIATQNECQRMDNKFVNELANETIDDMLKRGMIRESDKSMALERVSLDIWQDINSEKISRQAPIKTKNNIVDQYMRNHYEKEREPSLPGLTVAGFPSVSSSIWSTGEDKNLTFPSYPLPMPLSRPSYASPTTYTTALGPPAPPVMYPPPPTVPPTIPLAAQTYPYMRPPPTQPLPTRPVVMTTVVAVQVAVETRTSSTMTEPYEPYKEDLMRAVQERDSVQAKLQESLGLLHKRELDYKALDMELSSSRLMSDQNRKLFEEKQNVMITELNRQQQQLKQSHDAMKEYQTQLMEAEKKMVLYDKARREDKDLVMQLLAEKDQAVASNDQLQKSHDRDVARASSAEIEVLKLRKQFTLSMLERSQKEAVFHQRRLGTMMQKMVEQNQPVPKHFQQMMDHYKLITPKCEETIVRLTREFDDQVQEVNNGRPLSELPEIQIPPPPPAPPVLHQPLLQGGMSHSPTLPLMAAKSGGDYSPDGDNPPLMMPSLHDKKADEPVARPKNVDKWLPPKPLVPPNGSQPRPLAPPTRTLGFLPPRPLGPRPLSAAVRPQLRPGLSAVPPKHNSFEKLMAKLEVTIPKYNRNVFVRLIQELRQAKGGSLSGATMDEIVNEIVQLIRKHEQKQNQVPSTAQPQPSQKPAPPKPIAPPPGLATNWAFSSSEGTGAEEVFEEDEDPCVICHEEMTPTTTRTLDCSHRFHDECIRMWFKEQSTCPNCRIHALLPDEFPSLK